MDGWMDGLMDISKAACMYKKDLFEEGFSCSLQAVATEFKKLHEPKVAKFKGGYSSDASLVYQSWLKDIWVHTIECHLSQWEVIQLVKITPLSKPGVRWNIIWA